MKRRWSPPISALLAMACCSVQAQDLCAELESLIGAAPSSFVSLRGARDGDFYQAKKSLPNADECTVYRDGNDLNSYDCEWSYDDSDSAAQAFDSFSASVAACLQPIRTDTRNGGAIERSVKYLVQQNDRFSVDVSVTHRQTRRGRQILELSISRRSSL